MKVKVLHHTEESAMRGFNRERHRVRKNPGPLLHPFERVKEYTRAVRTAQLDRMFAKPFLGAMDAQSDSSALWSGHSNLSRKGTFAVDGLSGYGIGNRH